MRNIILVSALALSLGACAGMDNRTSNGALLGGAGGAVIGGVASHSVGGAVVGGVVGAATGAIVADVTRPRYQYRHCYYSDREGRRICR